MCVPASPWKIALVCENTAVNHALERNAKKESDKLICTPKVGQTFGGAYFYGKKRK